MRCACHDGRVDHLQMTTGQIFWRGVQVAYCCGGAMRVARVREIRERCGQYYLALDNGGEIDARYAVVTDGRWGACGCGG